MDLNTFQNFFNINSEDIKKSELEAKEEARELLKKYKCFDDLLNNKLDILEECQNTLLVNALRNIRQRPEVDRSYVLAINDVFYFLRFYFQEYNKAKELLNGGIN